jgi:hypothetical protein
MAPLTDLEMLREHPYFRDKGIRRKKERVTVLMSRMVAGGGSSTNMDCNELLLLSFELRASRK